MKTIKTNLNKKTVVGIHHKSIYSPEKMTLELEKLIGEVEADIALHGLSPAFDTVEEFIASLK